MKEGNNFVENSVVVLFIFRKFLNGTQVKLERHNTIKKRLSWKKVFHTM